MKAIACARKFREDIDRNRPPKRPDINVDLSDIAGKVDAGERLDAEDGLALFQSADLLTVGLLANLVRERRHGDKTYYNVNRHLNPTNVCVVGCELCAYQDNVKAPGTWSYSPEQCVEIARRDYTPDVTEFHIVGGLHPHWKFDVYVDILKALKKAFPDVHLKAFTMVEIDWLARLAKLSIEDTVDILRDAGLDSCPGGGAEIFVPARPRDHRAQQDRRGSLAGGRGHLPREGPAHQRDHVLRARRDLRGAGRATSSSCASSRTKTGGFDCFIPLAFHPENTPFEGHMGATDGFDDLKVIAVSRLMLDNFDHIKSYWVMLTQKIAQVGLRFGANDLDGTIIDERITKAAGGVAGAGMTREQIEDFIREAGRTPVERNTTYTEFKKRTEGAVA